MYMNLHLILFLIMMAFNDWKSGADPGFLEKGFICIHVKVLGFALLIISNFS